MDPLEKLLKAMCKNRPDFENLDQYNDYFASNGLPFEDFIQYLRTLASQVTSSDVLDLLSRFFDTPFVGFFTGMNLQEFSNLYPSEPKFLLKILSLITSPKHAETIFDLIITTTEENSGTSPRKMDWEMWSEFTKMKNLNCINIDQYYFTLEDLMAMCENLPALRSIKVVICTKSRLAIEDPDFAQIFCDRFNNLEEFFYSLTAMPDADNFLSEFTFFREFTNFCIKHLPKAREVRCEDLIFDMSEACGEMDRTSLMEQLQLYPINLDKVASNAEKFPHVLSLTLDWNRLEMPLIKETWESLKKWTKLIHLKNNDLSSEEHFELILSTFGANLKILYFGCSFETTLDIDFKLIQENCPKLENLELFFTGVNDDNSLGTFNSLLHLKITFKSDVRKEVKLTNLLAAPNLQIVELSGFRVSLLELKRTVLSIKIKSILTKIETLSLLVDESIDAKLKNSIIFEFRYLNSAILSLRDGGEASVKLDFK